MPGYFNVIGEAEPKKRKKIIPTATDLNSGPGLKELINKGFFFFK